MSWGEAQSRVTLAYSCSGSLEVTRTVVRGEFIDVGVARLYYYAGGTRGAGEPLLLVHGFPTSSFLWSRVVPLVPAGYRVVVPDLLGFGRSDPPQLGATGTDLTAAGHASRLIRLLDVLGIERATAAGHGIGARIALEMCAMHSHRISRLGLVNPITQVPGGDAAPPALRTIMPAARALPARVLLATLRRRISRLYGDPGVHGPALDHYLRPFRGPQGAAVLLAHLRALMLTERTHPDATHLGTTRGVGSPGYDRVRTQRCPCPAASGRGAQGAPARFEPC